MDDTNHNKIPTMAALNNGDRVLYCVNPGTGGYYERECIVVCSKFRDLQDVESGQMYHHVPISQIKNHNR